MEAIEEKQPYKNGSTTRTASIHQVDIGLTTRIRHLDVAFLACQSFFKATRSGSAYRSFLMASSTVSFAWAQSSSRQTFDQPEEPFYVLDHSYFKKC
jgi:hypothetical protein